MNAPILPPSPGAIDICPVGSVPRASRVPTAPTEIEIQQSAFWGVWSRVIASKADTVPLRMRRAS